ncbi:hypothetical protein niasHS_006871 [Heterodera schachtii]|uniref:Uncharacterized protein n=1 Tax=Heterodera schachtii TaxID=97005 RepID=A0ABD2JFY8_HETSC
MKERTPKKKQIDVEDDSRFMDLAKAPMFREMRRKEHKVQIDDKNEEPFSFLASIGRIYSSDQEGTNFSTSQYEMADVGVGNQQSICFFVHADTSDIRSCMSSFRRHQMEESLRKEWGKKRLPIIKSVTKMKRKMKERIPKKKQMDVETDSRFMDLAKNPMFREMRKKEHKVQIDDRFKNMLVDKDFREDAFQLMDRRGRPTTKKSRDAHLSHIYELCHDEKKAPPSVSGEIQFKRSSSCETTDSESDIECDPNVLPEDKVQQIQFDLARGQGNISSSSDDESSDEMFDRKTEENKEGEEEDNWGELDKEVRRVEWASSKLAICNLDWGNVRAADLMLLFNSLKPNEGKIHSVSVYLSDFGAESTEREKRDGPMLKVKRSNRKGNEREEEDKLEEQTKKAIRAHELDKLRYYYAVCVCDSVDTATAIYEACDGVEYESSGLRFDIRFIPEGMEFETERIREEILSDQFSADWYRPRKVGMHTLTASNPKMSWETDDPERRRALKRAFEEEAKLEEFNAFIGSDSEEEEKDEENQRNAKRDMLLAAAREGLLGNLKAQQSKDEEKDDEQHEKVEKEKADEKERAGNESDGEDREITDEDSEEEAVDIQRPKRKTKFQLYLERKKQLKQERKQEEAKQRKRRRGDELNPPDNEKAPSTDAAQVQSDERFSAFFVDSAFAIDRTSSHYKGGNLADRQAKERQKRRSVLIYWFYRCRNRNDCEQKSVSILQKAEKKKAQGVEAYRRKDFKEAIRLFGDAIDELRKVSKESSEQLDEAKIGELMSLCENNNAACYDELGNTEKCLDHCNLALQIKPSYEKAMRRRARTHFKLGHNDKAMNDYLDLTFMENVSKESRNTYHVELDRVAEATISPLLNEIFQDKIGKPMKIPQMMVCEWMISTVTNDPLLARMNKLTNDLNDDKTRWISALDDALLALKRGEYDEIASLAVAIINDETHEIVDRILAVLLAARFLFYQTLKEPAMKTMQQFEHFWDKLDEAQKLAHKDIHVAHITLQVTLTDLVENESLSNEENYKIDETAKQRCHQLVEEGLRINPKNVDPLKNPFIRYYEINASLSIAIRQQTFLDIQNQMFMLQQILTDSENVPVFAFIFLSKFAMLLHNNQIVLEACKKTLEKMPNCAYAIYLLGLVDMSERLDLSQVVQSMENAMRKAIEADPNYWEPYRIMGKICGEKKKFAQASDFFSTALSLARKRDEIMVLLKEQLMINTFAKRDERSEYFPRDMAMK